MNGRTTYSVPLHLPSKPNPQTSPWLGPPRDPRDYVYVFAKPNAIPVPANFIGITQARRALPGGREHCFDMDKTVTSTQKLFDHFLLHTLPVPLQYQ